MASADKSKPQSPNPTPSNTNLTSIALPAEVPHPPVYVDPRLPPEERRTWELALRSLHVEAQAAYLTK